MHIEPFTQIPSDMKKGILIMLTAFLLAFATFTYWFVIQQNINQELHTIEQQLTSFEVNP